MRTTSGGREICGNNYPRATFAVGEARDLHRREVMCPHCSSSSGSQPVPPPPLGPRRGHVSGGSSSGGSRGARLRETGVSRGNDGHMA